MLLNKKVQAEKRWLHSRRADITKHSELCHVISDPTRVKILMLLNRHGKLCVTDLANIVGVSISAISHQLDLLEHAGVVSNKRMGRVVRYYPQLGDNVFLKIVRLTLGKSF
ncbi:MAG: metalloregulator ArsR/SmtB family transcription factor [Patescibacteria group bacterium]